MATIKISELPVITSLSANNANTTFVAVDKTTGTTGQFNTTTLAANLYANNILNVGTTVPSGFYGLVAQFISNTAIFSQVNFQNRSPLGSGDVVVTADNGDDGNNFINMGVQGSNMAPDPAFDLPNNDGYIYMHGRDNQRYGNLWIGTATSNTDLIFFTGDHKQGGEVARFRDNVAFILRSRPLQFADGTSQNTAAAPANYTQSAFDRANTASANTIITQGVDATQNTNISLLQGAMTTANANITFLQAINNTQNTNITAVNQYAVSAFDTANSANSLAVVTSNFLNANVTYFQSIDNAQNTQIQGIFGVNITQNTDIVAVNGYAGSSFAKANAALANTSGTFVGDLRILGNTFTVSANIQTTGSISVNNSSFATNSSLVRITASDSFATVAPSNTNYMLHITGKANSVTRLVLDSFGANTYGLFTARTGRGSAAAPSPTQNNDVVLRIAGNGYTPAGFRSSSPTKIDFVAGENFTNSNTGTRIEFWNTPNGSNNIQKIASFNANTVEFLGSVNPQRGIVWSPRLPAGAQTAITIDFLTDSIIKANLTADLTVTLTNFQFGKVCEVWLTNTGAQNRTVTHGVAAINSTNKATTYTITAGSSAYLRYFSITGDAANTFLAII